jgi:hypothetical protein
MRSTQSASKGKASLRVGTRREPEASDLRTRDSLKGVPRACVILPACLPPGPLQDGPESPRRLDDKDRWEMSAVNGGSPLLTRGLDTQ